MSKQFRFVSLFEKADLFERPLPSFNVRGRDAVPSCAGGSVSIVAMAVLLIYSLMKLQTLLLRDSPSVSGYIDKHTFSATDKLNLEDVGMRFAFTIEGYLDHELRMDPRYVKIIARIKGYDSEGKITETILPYHECSREELEEFDPPSVDSEFVFQRYIKGERKLLCFDWEKFYEEIEIGGLGYSEKDYKRVDILLVPCNYVHNVAGDIGDKVSDVCDPSRENQTNYL